MSNEKEDNYRRWRAEDDGPHYWRDQGADWGVWFAAGLLIIGLLCMATGGVAVVFF